MCVSDIKNLLKYFFLILNIVIVTSIVQLKNVKKLKRIKIRVYRFPVLLLHDCRSYAPDLRSTKFTIKSRKNR